MLRFIGRIIFYTIYGFTTVFLFLVFIGYKWGLTDEEREEFKDLIRGKKDQWKYRKYSKII